MNPDAPPPPAPRTRTRDLAITLAAVACAAAARALVYHLGGTRYLYMPFFPAVIVAALVGGLGQGLLAVALSAVAAVYWMPPVGTFHIESRDDAVSLAFFACTNVFTVAACEFAHRARGRAQRAEVHRLATEGKLRRVLESITDGFVTLDPDWNITYINSRGAAITSRTPADLIGRNLWDAFPESVGSKFDHAYRRAVATKEPVRDLDYFPPLSRWIEVNAYPSAEGLSVFFADVTDRVDVERERARLLERETAARAQAEHASRMKDEFLATLSHELRTPLNAVLGWSQILARDVDDDAAAQDLADLRQGLESIDRNARAQARLIDDLLDMNRIDGGKLRLDPRPVDPADCVRAAIDTVTPAAHARGVRLDAALDPRAGPVPADPDRLQQIVWNLLANAIKFTPRGGRVQITLQRVNSHVEITVSDTGEGIPPDFLPHVFERFRQADASSTRRHGGLGIGLSIAKHLAELHGGSLTAHSAGPRQGATFTLVLPLAPIQSTAGQGAGTPSATPGPVPLQSPAPTDEHHIDLSPMRILVVDDQADARELLHRVLHGRGRAAVTTASSAAEGLSLLKRDRPDVLVCDIGMPDIDGYAFIRAVRALPPEQGGRTPALALTAFARPEDRTRALVAGYNLHLAKPADPTELLATLATLTPDPTA